MLNTKNWFETAVGYIGILAIVAATLWQFFAWPAPDKIFTNVLASETAREVDRFQILLGMLGSGALLALAYLWNGKHERNRLRSNDERSASSLGHGLALETEDLAEACTRHAVRINALAKASHLADAELIKLQETDKQLSLTDNLALLDLDYPALANLGRNGHAGVNQIRQSLRTLEQALAAVGDSDSQPSSAITSELRDLATAYAGVALVARNNQNLFETIYRSGVATADERTLSEPVSKTAAARHMRVLTEGANSAKPAAIPIRNAC